MKNPNIDVANITDGSELTSLAFAQIPLSSDAEELKGLYGAVDRKVQEDVPMFSAYIIKSMAAVNKRLVNAQPSVYGFFNHVEQWDVSGE